MTSSPPPTSDLSKDPYGPLGIYAGADGLKKALLASARTTAKNAQAGMQILEQFYGESVFVYRENGVLVATVNETLGSKNLVALHADVMKDWGHRGIAATTRCAVATVLNDLWTSGAIARVFQMHLAIAKGDEMHGDISRGIVEGMVTAMQEASCVYVGGETPVLGDQVKSGTYIISGNATGRILKEEHLIDGSKLQPGDHLMLCGARGLHANWYTGARGLAKEVDGGYNAPLGDGRTFVEALLEPTVLYGGLLQVGREMGVLPSYVADITGHAARKFMRHPGEFTYRIKFWPEISALYAFIMKHARMEIKPAFRAINMGVGYAVFVRPNDVEKFIRAGQQVGVPVWDGGVVEQGERQVIIEPFGISIASVL